MKLKKKHKNTKPYPFQRECALEIEAFDGRALLAMPMGTGKSLISLLWAHWNPDIRPIIIICPATLKWNWKRECKLHFGWDARVLESTTPDTSDFRRRDILIINYDILYAWVDYLRALKPKLIIIDEIHFIKEGSSRRARATRAVASAVKHILGLSGTPLLNRPRELQPTLKLIRPDVKLFRTISGEFGQEFCKPRLTPWGWKYDGADNLNKLHKILKDTLMIRRTKEEVLTQLPQKQRIIIPIEIKRRREYDMAVNDFLYWLSKHSTAKARKAARAEHLSKITYLKMLTAELKLPNVISWIEDFLEESDEKLVLFAIHKKIIAELRDRFKGSIVIDGDTPMKKRVPFVDDFNKNKKKRILIGNIQAAGVGLNMTGAANVGHVELPWTPAEVMQATDRCHRIGQTRQVREHFFVGRGTIDEKMCAVLQKKQRHSDQILDGVPDMDRLNILDELTDALKTETFKKHRKGA